RFHDGAVGRPPDDDARTHDLGEAVAGNVGAGAQDGFFEWAGQVQSAYQLLLESDRLARRQVPAVQLAELHRQPTAAACGTVRRIVSAARSASAAEMSKWVQARSTCVPPSPNMMPFAANVLTKSWALLNSGSTSNQT